MAVICPVCRKLINIIDFIDEVSRKEFERSGLCQCCQECMFNENARWCDD